MVFPGVRRGEELTRETYLPSRGTIRAVRLDESLAGKKLTLEVEATDTRGARQLERDAGTIRVAS